MAAGLEVALWLGFASIAIGGLGLFVLWIWVVSRAILRGLRDDPQPLTPSVIQTSAFSSVTVSNSVGIVGTIWLTLLVLFPILALALWQFAVELERGRVGASLVLAIVHLVLIWALMRLGTRVQRKVEFSRIGLVVHPVIGSRCELAWSAIVRVDDVSYIGPGVSGLYLYEADGLAATLDVWLPNWESLRAAVRELTPHSIWSDRRRGWLVG